MSVTIRELISNNQKHFRLKLLAGEAGLDFVCTWVHMMEDCRVADFFWGNEMVVTSGYSTTTEDDIFTMVQTLFEKNCAGLVINSGPYISKVPEKVIAFCEQESFPLLIMPWEKSMTEFVRDCCTQIVRSMVDEECLAESAMEMVRYPDKKGKEEEQLSEYFDAEKGFVFVSLGIVLDGADRKRFVHRNLLRIRSALREFSFQFLVFRLEQHIILLINEQDMSIVRLAADQIQHYIMMRFPDTQLQIGIGEPVASLTKLNLGLQTAQAARRQSLLSKQCITEFSDLGFLKLFYTVSDTSVLQHYYQDVMKPLIEYEESARKEGIFVETLFRYLLSDCSLQKVAKAMYIHENTAYYRMNRIREILDNPLNTQALRQPFLMAYYCGVILNIVPEY